MNPFIEVEEDLETLLAERDAFQLLLERCWEMAQAEAITERLRSYREVGCANGRL